MTDSGLQGLERRLQRLENQVQALRHSNLLLLTCVGLIAQGRPLTAAQLETLRGQYRAVTSLATKHK